MNAPYTIHRIIILMVLPFILLLSGCNDDDNGSGSPLSQLPPATQTGAGTFGCLVNGEVFIPSGSGFGPPVLDCVYQYVDGGYYFNLQGNRKNNGILQGITLSTKALQIHQGETYQLLENAVGNAKGGWFLDEPDYTFVYTSQEHTGALKITHLDEGHGIVSGTFWFDVQLPTGEIIEVREGRFDARFAN